jgi:hypothetical protein
VVGSASMRSDCRANPGTSACAPVMRCPRGWRAVTGPLTGPEPGRFVHDTF